MKIHYIRIYDRQKAKYKNKTENKTQQYNATQHNVTPTTTAQNAKTEERGKIDRTDEEIKM